MRSTLSTESSDPSSGLPRGDQSDEGAGDDPDPGPERGSRSPECLAGLAVAGLVTASAQAAVAVVALGSFVLAFLSSLFENALHHHSRVRLVEAARDPALLERIDALLLEEDEIVFASKIARGLAQIAGIACIVMLLVAADPTTWAALAWSLAIAAVWLLVIVAGPYVLARRAGHAILLRGLIPYCRMLAAVRPVSAVLQAIASRVLRAGAAPDPSEEIADEILSKVEEGAREGSLDTSEKQMIEGVMDLREATAEEVMTPRTEMISLPVNATVQEAVAKSIEHGHSRLPVYRDTPDDILGVLYVKDLLPALSRAEAPKLRKLVRRAFYVPQSKNVGELLKEMQARRVHMAIVVDEYGGTAGVVTIEDILEEIVGEIADEHENQTPEDVVKITDSAATVEGHTHIDALHDALGLAEPEAEDYDTVGGLLFTHLGRVPTTGEHYDINGVRFTVLEADERRINRVKVTVTRDAG